MSLLKVIRANPHKRQLSGKNHKCSRNSRDTDKWARL